LGLQKAYNRITFTRLTLSYFIFSILHSLLQLIFQIQAFRTNDNAHKLFEQVLEANNATVSVGEGMVFFDERSGELRWCRSLDSRSCEVVARTGSAIADASGGASSLASESGLRPPGTSVNQAEPTIPAFVANIAPGAPPTSNAPPATTASNSAVQTSKLITIPASSSSATLNTNIFFTTAQLANVIPLNRVIAESPSDTVSLAATLLAIAEAVATPPPPAPKSTAVLVAQTASVERIPAPTTAVQAVAPLVTNILGSAEEFDSFDDDGFNSFDDSGFDSFDDGNIRGSRIALVNNSQSNNTNIQRQRQQQQGQKQGQRVQVQNSRNRNGGSDSEDRGGFRSGGDSNSSGGFDDRRVKKKRSMAEMPNRRK
jgi:hypothetical protein